ncbi:hepatocyte cell adhesion molecule-like isoform X4 [Sebastes umbrosus]|uniref:hepatocyte cell adhesion molecule-like isoform X4 n=1 Tax=Sebastes umbrosus TaxID=72105 RepID=UPI00189E20E4|nr:hepatocyte cell adhesion molecule-like isoform X4 [Sebastes umbrosus]
MAPRCFLAFFILTSSLVVGQSPKYALKGGKVSLKPDIAELPDGILWKLDGNKVVEFNGKEEQVYSAFDKRITLGWVSAELQITDLRFEDSGEYELEVEVKKALHHRSVHKLEVIDEVAKPTISCEMNNGSSSKSSAQLECSSESRRPQSLTKFEWSTRGNVKPGPKLTISLGDERDDEVYSCIVSNPLSNETATFTAKDCYPEKSSSVALIASLLSIFVLLLVGVGVGIWFCKRHHKACFAKGDLEKPPGATEGDVDGHEEEPLTGRSPGTCDVDEEDETPRKGHVKDKMKLFGDRLHHSGGQTSLKKLQTENHTEEHKRTASPPPSPPPSESPSPLDLNNPASNDDSDADADQYREPAEEEVPQYDLSDSEKANEPDPADVSDKLSEDAQSNSQFYMAPEQPEPEKEAHDEEKPATSETSPAVQPHSPATKSSPNMALEDTAGEHEEASD